MGDLRRRGVRPGPVVSEVTAPILVVRPDSGSRSGAWGRWAVRRRVSILSFSISDERRWRTSEYHLVSCCPLGVAVPALFLA